MSWDCPYVDKGCCQRTKKACQPGKPGCILKGKVRLIGKDGEENDK